MIWKIFYTIVALLVMVSVAVMGLALARSHSAPVAATSPAPHSTHAPSPPKVTTPAPPARTPAPVTSTPAPAAGNPLVCTDPSSGCTTLVARPSVITLTMEGSEQIVSLVWSSWGGPTATAQGTYVEYGIAEHSFNGSFPEIVSSYPVTVTESEPQCDGPGPCPGNYWVYTLTTTTAPAPWQSFNINS
jgi:hypothetical protein